MHYGVDVLQTQEFRPLKGARIGLMTNPSAVNQHLQSTYEVFTRSDLELVAFFAPEHGFMGAVADGVKINAQVDRHTGLPIHSLYGDSLRPTAAMLDDVDVIVCDIQDIGVRYYTFIWTISHILEAAGAHGVRVMILDRPNPLGSGIAGRLLEADLASLVGRFPIPIQHGMTYGELLTMINATWNPTPAELSVILCDGWQRETGWPVNAHWIPPSPNMPHLSTVRQYPGACLIEGTNLSEGRGTALPFEIVGAPFIDGAHLAAHLNEQGWAGVKFRPHSFRPCTSKWSGEDCGGVAVHITEGWQPLELWLGIIREIRHLYPDDFAWLPHHFDRLIGTIGIRQQIDTGASLDQLTVGWAAFCADFQQQREAFLRY